MIPPISHFLFPFLDALKDGKQHNMKEIKAHIILYLNINQEDLHERTEGGKYYRFTDRLRWTATYLKKALLVSSTTRGCYEITDRGKKAYKNINTSISTQSLLVYKEFKEYRGK